ASIVNNAAVSAVAGDSSSTSKTAHATIADAQAGTPATIHTVAGNGPNNMPAREAYLLPRSIAVDRQGNVFASDHLQVFKVDQFGLITRYAGVGSVFSTGIDNSEVGNGGPAIDAPIAVSSMAFDSSGNLLVGANQSLRRIDRQTGIITQVVGNDLCTPI